MTGFLLFIFLLLVAIVVLVKRKPRNSTALSDRKWDFGWTDAAKLKEGKEPAKVKGELEFFIHKTLLSHAEQKYFLHLQDVIGDKYYVSMKVRIADVVRHTSKDRSAWLSEFGKMAQKHFDFVLVNREDFQITHAIELDDSSHSKPKQVKRDTYVNDLADKAGLKLLRIPTQGKYDIGKTLMQIEGPPPTDLSQPIN